MDGANVILKVDIGTAGAPDFQPAGSQTGVSLDRVTNMIQSNHKLSEYDEYEAGKIGWSLSLDALYVPSEAQFEALRTAWRGKAKVQVGIEYPAPTGGGSAPDPEYGYAFISSMSESFPDNDNATITVSLQGTGELFNAALPTGA